MSSYHHKRFLICLIPLYESKTICNFEFKNRCCCDYRRAVIVLAIITIVLGVAGIIGTVASSAFINTLPVDDDDLVDIIRKSNQINAIFTGIGIVAAICALLGAMKYNIGLVAVNIVWLVLSFIATTVVTVLAYKDLDEQYEEENIQTPYPSFIVGAIFTALFVYPHVGFVTEVKSGIMSEETYPREEFSCCCVQERRAA